MKIPERVKVDKGTIVIDRAIQENGNTGREKQRQWLRDFQLPVPPKPEQDQMVRYLDWKTLEMNRFIHHKKTNSYTSSALS